MQLTCPCCAARFALEAALGDVAAREAVAAAARLPAPLGDLVLRYIGLFRPASRALAWDRAARLLAELLEPIRAGRLHRHGREWVAPQDHWQRALEAVLAARDNGKLRTPLSSHGYLYEVLTGLSDRAEAQAEQATEQARRQGRGPERAATPTAPAPVPHAGPRSVADVLALHAKLKAG